jgi:hypothetical protein
LVFAAFGVLRWPECVTVTTALKLDPAEGCGYANAW